MLGEAKPPISGQGWCPKGQSPRPKGLRAGWGPWEGEAPSPPAMGLGSAVGLIKLTQRGSGRKISPRYIDRRNVL